MGDLLQCPICLQPLTAEQVMVAVVKCGHIYHRHCIIPAIHNDIKCPLCRKKMEAIMRLFGEGSQQTLDGLQSQQQSTHEQARTNSDENDNIATFDPSNNYQTVSVIRRQRPLIVGRNEAGVETGPLPWRQRRRRRRRTRRQRMQRMMLFWNNIWEPNL